MKWPQLTAMLIIRAILISTAANMRKGRRLIDRWWVPASGGLAAAWVLVIVTIYFRLQIARMMELMGLAR